MTTKEPSVSERKGNEGLHPFSFSLSLPHPSPPRRGRILSSLRFFGGLLSLVLFHLGAFGIRDRRLCMPGFHCHGCPWSTGACPIGVLAHGAAVRTPLLFSALSFLLVIGFTLGRLVCGFFCPFGWFQDLLYRLPTRKIRLPRWTRWGKYLALILLVFTFPAWLGLERGGCLKIEKPTPVLTSEGSVELVLSVTNIGEKPIEGVALEIAYVPVAQPPANAPSSSEFPSPDVMAKTPSWRDSWLFPSIVVEAGKSVRLPTLSLPNLLRDHAIVVTSPQCLLETTPRYDLYYCKICPVGTLTAYLPSLASREANPSGGILGTASSRWFRLLLLVFFLLLMVFVSRAFCRTFCPLGAIYGLCARFALIRILPDPSKTCTHCNLCHRACPMELDVYREAGSAECIACGACISICPHQALRWVVGFKDPARQSLSASSIPEAKEGGSLR